MKFLKIFSAILFFSFVGNFHNQLFAQGKDIGYWTNTLKSDECMSSYNGKYRAKLENGIGEDVTSIYIVVYKTLDNTVVRKLFLTDKSTGNGKVLKLRLTRSKNISWVEFDTEYRSGFLLGTGKITKEYRSQFVNDCKGKLLNNEVETDGTAYFQLEDDGRFVIYNETGFFGGAGTPIIEFMPR